MNNIKKRLLSFLLIITFCTAMVASSGMTAMSEASNTAKSGSTTAGEIASKEEVIYAALDSSGITMNIYVVNILNLIKEGIVRDYGTYSSVKNLSSTQQLDFNSDSVTTAAPIGRFYYQGNMEALYLPWDINITYKLDGKLLSGSELAGKSGHLEINLQTTQNKSVNTSFYHNYLVQISLTMDTNRCRNITAANSTIANAGSNKRIAFTVMPSKEGNFTVSADVTDFIMDSIELSAVPFSMNIELPDTSELTGNLLLLSEAIGQLNSGITSLKEGLLAIDSGTASLDIGSAEFKSGLDQIHVKSASLVRASASISTALTTISAACKGADTNDLSAFSLLPSGLSALSTGLEEIAKGMKDLSNGYTTAYTALDSAIAFIPDQEISPEALQKLRIDNPQNDTVNQLLETYAAARTVKATYQMVLPAYASVGPGLTTMSDSITTISTSLNDISMSLTTSFGDNNFTSSLSQLLQGITTLSDNYEDFHAGLTQYTGGISQLTEAYTALDRGISNVAEGTKQLNSGISELSNGTLELKDKTTDMPKQVTTTMEELIAEYDKTNFTPISFVSSKNSNVTSVQFVMKTEKISKVETSSTEVVQEDTANFWTRLKELFI
jgi:putative membrane protein